MALSTRCLARIARTPIHRTQWNRLPRRLYSTSAEDSIQELPMTGESSNPKWFQRLRLEMLGRKPIRIHDSASHDQQYKLRQTLSGFLPTAPRAIGKDIAGVGYTGNHLIYFNSAPPAEKLLPDGTDELHSPGEPFVRRMWAGGSVRVNLARYFGDEDFHGWKNDVRYVCIERIKDVQLRGQGDEAKIFVNIERRIASMERLLASANDAKVSWYEVQEKSFEEDTHKGDGKGGNSMLVEERNLVFMQERSDAELAAIKTGEIPPIKYLKAPGNPDFRYTLTPTSSLLSRFSALTFNAHAIHLDREYCRTVEGHRNLLVHGPLTLMLMTKFIATRLSQFVCNGYPATIAAIEYKNLAPLYCDEPMKLCARERESHIEGGYIYDVWIEGPTGGVAVKGTVSTTLKPGEKPLPGYKIPNPTKSQTEPKVGEEPKVNKTSKPPISYSVVGGPLIRSVSFGPPIIKPISLSLDSEESTPVPPVDALSSRNTAKPLAGTSTAPGSIHEPLDSNDATQNQHEYTLEELNDKLSHLRFRSRRAYRLQRAIARRILPESRSGSSLPRSRLPTSESPPDSPRGVRYFLAPPSPMEAMMSARNRMIIDGYTREPTKYTRIDPLPIIRKHTSFGLEEKKKQRERETEPVNKFKLRGLRFIGGLRIKMTGESRTRGTVYEHPSDRDLRKRSKQIQWVNGKRIVRRW